MKILCPLKRVPDPYAKPRPLPDGAVGDGSGIDPTGLKFEINPFDEIAIEAAVRLRDGGLDAEIITVCIGTSAAEDQLRKALAMGADRAILIELDSAVDSLAVATELAEVVNSEEIDLVLMGKQATDDDSNQTGQMLAGMLDWPQATFASALSIEANIVRVTRETDLGEEVLQFQLPGLVTADLRLAEPRYIALPGIIKARSKPLEKRAPTSHLTTNVRLVSLQAAPVRTAGRRLQSVPELVAALADRGVLA